MESDEVAEHILKKDSKPMVSLETALREKSGITELFITIGIIAAIMILMIFAGKVRC